MSNTNWKLGALVLTLGGAFAASAQAQEAAQPAPAAEQEDGGAEAEESKHPMGWIGVGLKLGAGGVGSGSFDNPVYDAELAGGAGMAGVAGGGANGCSVFEPTCDTDSRAGFQISLPISMGGDGFGWDLEPYANFASGASAYGMYTGPKFDIHIIDPLYVGFGFGLKAAYVASDNFDYAADLYGRVPIRGTYYLLNDLGLTAELGLGYGMSGYATVPTEDIDANGDGTPEVEGKEGDFAFGSALTWDFSVGVRWP
jgi:hypothetical protein